MQHYNVSSDQIEEVSVLFYLWYRFRKLKYDLIRWVVFGIAVPGKKICRECIENCALRYHNYKRDQAIKEWHRIRQERFGGKQ